MKQTAVDWLFQQLWQTPKDKFTWYSILEQAKQMEKERIETAYNKGTLEEATEKYSLKVAQPDSVYVIKSSDAMSGKTHVYGSKNFIVANDTKEKGFIVDTYINDNLSIQMITVVMVGIGSCNENDEIIILFENGEKILKK
jgi:hypothetical protein